MGPVLDMGGYGSVSRYYLQALEAAGIPVYVSPIGPAHDVVGPETRRWLNGLSTTRLGNRVACVWHGVADWFAFPPPPLPNIKRRIGITLFETDRIPAGWAELCNGMDEVWVPSAFNFDTFSRGGVSPAKLRVVPYPIDVARFDPGRAYRPIRLSPHAFAFLYVFAFNHRKGFDLLIQAFCRAFSAQDDVSLVLKTYVNMGSHSDDYVMAEFTNHIPADRLNRQIFVINESFDEDRLIDLYQSCDAYISVDRAGWGLPAMQTMALGKPVLSLRWGGYTAFMNDANSIPIDVEPELVPVDEKLQRESPRYYGNHLWANVNPDKVAMAMRETVLNPERRQRVAVQAARDMRVLYAPPIIGASIDQLLS